jgi:hypothetical protein
MPNDRNPSEQLSKSAKERAQRVDYGYFKRIPALRLWMLVLIIFALALVAAAAFVLSAGARGTQNALSPGPLSSPHALWAQRCEVCHTKNFSRIPDSACLKCHDGPTHPAKDVDQARLNKPTACQQCHLEHRGDIRPMVSADNCVVCHGDLKVQASAVKLRNVNITEFSAGFHPEFSPKLRGDSRPLKLNHAAHMPDKPKVVQGIKLPMQCTDCHAIDRNPRSVNPVPVTFEQNCKSCHARELEFDVYQLLKTSTPAPHTKDPRTIHEFILSTYQKLLAADPGIVRRPLGNDVVAQPNAATWLSKVVSSSEAYLFGSPDGHGGRAGKCEYCHEIAGRDAGFPVIAKVNRIQGRFEIDQPEGEPWFVRGEYSHRTHRSIQCESCHTEARTSAKTSDVLIPVMKSCLPCHASGRTGLDGCSECHLFHNKNREKEERRPTDQVLSDVLP